MLGELGKLLYELRFDFLAWRRLGASLCKLIVFVLSYSAPRGTLLSFAASSVCIFRFSDVSGEDCCSLARAMSTSASAIFFPFNDRIYEARQVCDYNIRALFYYLSRCEGRHGLHIYSNPTKRKLWRAYARRKFLATPLLSPQRSSAAAHV